uniref:N-acetyltransferase domain-containing protein n=1 Tax=viral metagenome TaxID=1070528 RepID=A0A6C0J9U0_9ZZZZ
MTEQLITKFKVINNDVPTIKLEHTETMTSKVNPSYHLSHFRHENDIEQTMYQILSPLMNFNIMNNKNITLNEINILINSVGRGKYYYKTEEVWNKILNSSEHVAYIRYDKHLSAFGRIVEDGVMCMFYDICVHPKYHSIGIGTLLMNNLIDKIKNKDYVSISMER